MNKHVPATTQVDQASGNAPLFAEVHALLPELRRIEPSQGAMAPHLKALEEELVADAPVPTKSLSIWRRSRNHSRSVNIHPLWPTACGSCGASSGIGTRKNSLDSNR